MILEPVCTCDTAGITGCTMHPIPTVDQTTIDTARAIATGNAYTDQDAIRVAMELLRQTGR